MKILQILSVLILLAFCSLKCSDELTPPVIDPNEPVANIGENQTINIGSYFVFDASKSTRGNGDTLTYKWSQDPLNPEQFIFYSRPDFYDAAVKEGTYTYTLVVNNGITDSKPAQLTVTVRPRLSTVIPDTALEALIRFTVKKQTGDLVDTDFLSIDSLYAHRTLLSSLNIKNLHGIERCKNLKSLGLSLQSVSDLSPLSNLTGLEKIVVDQNRIISDVTPLANLTNLKYLRISDNQVTDISALANLKDLTYLDIQGNPVYHVTDISVVANFKHLQTFAGAFLPLPSLSVFSELTELEVFFCPYCQINDLSGFKNCSKLRELYIGSNAITDLTPISDLKEIQVLWVDANQIYDITPLQNLEKLKSVLLDNNLVKDIKPLVDNKGIGTGTTITLRNNPLNNKSLNDYIPQLIARGVNIIR